MTVDNLPTISRSEHKARTARGERASGTYALVFPRTTTIQEHLTHSFDVRDENDHYLTSGAANGAAMARLKAEKCGATFIVDEA